LDDIADVRKEDLKPEVIKQMELKNGNAPYDRTFCICEHCWDYCSSYNSDPLPNCICDGHCS